MANENGRYQDELFPSDYASWRYCIEEKCGLALTPGFVQKRMAILGNPKLEETQRFAKLYGEPYREQVLAWFKRAADEA